MNDLKEYYRPSDQGLLRDILLLVLIFAIPFFIHLGDIPLMDPDEGRYAEIPREMLERADFITPTLNYVKYFEKPPLLYWLNAASIEIFGENEFAVRFPSALCGLLTVLATYLIARRLYDRRTAMISSFILGTSTGFLIQSRIILTDTLLTFCIVVSLGSFIVASKREGRRKSPLWLLFLFFFSVGGTGKRIDRDTPARDDNFCLSSLDQKTGYACKNAHFARHPDLSCRISPMVCSCHYGES